MQLHVLYSLASLLTLTQAARVVKVTKTVDNTVTNTNVVEGTVSTVTDWLTNTKTTTTTRYTSTYTLTIFGQPHTYVSVVSSEVEAPAGAETQAQEPAETSTPQETQPEETAQETQAQETQAPETSAAPSTQSPTTPAPSTSTSDSEDSVETADDASASLEPGYLLDSVLTAVNDGVCVVDYEYYDTTSTETVTSTSTLTSTITV